jgi:hypothetical protein
MSTTGAEGHPAGEGCGRQGKRVRLGVFPGAGVDGCCQHLVLMQSVESVLPVHLNGDPGRGCDNARAEGVPSDLAAPANTGGGRGQGVAGFRAGGQGGEPVPHFAM